MIELKKRLDAEYETRNSELELSAERPESIDGRKKIQ